jgi:hypothetical protein
MTVELLYLPGCPNHEDAADLIRNVLAAEGLQSVFIETPVSNSEEASSQAFPGSPTLRVNGQDIEDLPPDRQIGFACRTYSVGGRTQGLPPRSWLERAIRAARTLEEGEP